LQTHLVGPLPEDTNERIGTYTQPTVDFRDQIHHYVGLEFIKGTREMLLFDLDAQFVGVGLNPSLSLFLLVTVTGEKESAAAMLDCFKWIT